MLFALGWSGAGIGVAVFVLVISWLSDYLKIPVHYRARFDQPTIVLWPSSLILISEKAGIVGLTTSILINGFWYFLLGAMVWYGLSRHLWFLAIPLLLIASLCWWAATL